MDFSINVVIVVDRLGIFWYLQFGNDSDFFVCLVIIDLFGYVIIIDFKGNKIYILDKDGLFFKFIIFEGGIMNLCGLCIFDYGEMMVGECLIGIVKGIKYLE